MMIVYSQHRSERLSQAFESMLTRLLLCRKIRWSQKRYIVLAILDKVTVILTKGSGCETEVKEEQRASTQVPSLRNFLVTDED